MKKEITFNDYIELVDKLEIKIGCIEAVETVPKSYGLKLTVNFGGGIIKTVFTNLGKNYSPEQLLMVNLPFITNMAPVEFKGVKSEAMILLPTNIEGKELLNVSSLAMGDKIF